MQFIIYMHIKINELCDPHLDYDRYAQSVNPPKEVF